MSNNFDAKKVAVEEIKERFSNAKSAVLVDYRGLTVEEVTELRSKFRQAGVEYKVYKNNLVKIAIKDTPFEALSQDLTGPNAIAFGIEDAVIPAKIIKDFAKGHKKLELKAGIVEGSYCNLEQIIQIADLPSKEVLIGRFLGSVKAPVANFAYFLSNLIKEKEGNAEA
ncbi:50S ribosomal protein L10 [Fusibacter bizertensis]|jgi:LSU ribosomal protein L10P|uniref:Large ribosomal subunit protein uL10 n=1 Tax=Fusibacter bizertensis TaxID=1488331 RepID=A0ABT6NHL1_9FIRM|nr:50S ribosomal protein L10 [Fusibacter bizertensis]MDH8679920.1 50S ribosomal protein L10 [Fusibacter bizertensis]